MSQLREEGLYFTAHSAEHLRILAELGGKTRLQLVGDLDPSALDPDQVTGLVIRENRSLRDLNALIPLHRLTTLDISRCPEVDDLTPLARLPLSNLSLDLMPGLERPGALSPLRHSTTLTQLDLGQALFADSLDEALCPDAPLSYLRFGGNSLTHTGLRGLHRFRSLTELSLATDLTTRLSPEDREEITRLPALRRLRFNWQVFGWDGPPLPGITGLRFNNFTGTEDVSSIPTLFPNLHAMLIVLAPDTYEVPADVLAQFPVTPAVTKLYSVV